MYGYSQHISGATHRDGGTLDLVFTQDDSILKDIVTDSLFIHDIGFSMTSDHQFIEFMNS